MSAVLLVAPPFHLLDRPNLAVSLLKPALQRAEIPCDVLYLNLRFADFVGRELYDTLIDPAHYMSMVGEWLFAGDIFGPASPDPRSYVDEVLLGRYCDRELADRLLELRVGVSDFLDQVLAEVTWSDYAMVGVTSTYQQNCPGLALLRRVKDRHPRLATIIGGANCEGVMGAAIHDLFPFVDYVCSGEGDRILPILARKVLDGQPTTGLPGILVRGDPPLFGDDLRAPIVMNLDRLPYPDFDDYFAQLSNTHAASEVQSILSMETSRGCWWGEKHHCTFCGLNGEGMQYRGKSGRRALEELDFLIARYGNREVGMVDNILDLGYFETFLKELADRSFPPSIFYETKANLTREQLRLLARAGDREIQPGIESLSSAVLRLMDKGVTALQNVRLLKWCAELGIIPSWHFLYGFPGEDPAEYQRVADLVPSLAHLEPPADLIHIRLDRFSPNFDQAEARGFVNLRPLRPYPYVYPFPPEALARLACYFDYDYADGRDPDRYVQPLRRVLAEWRACHHTSRLELRLEADRLEIDDTRPAGARRTTTLRGPARRAYLALDSAKTARGLHRDLERQLGAEAPCPERVDRWLEQWLADRLVIREGPLYLGLAINPTERVRLPAERLAALLAAGGT